MEANTFQDKIFRPLFYDDRLSRNISNVIQVETFFRIFQRILHVTQFRKRRPIIVAAVDNFATPSQTHTNVDDVIKFLK